jgi:UDP-glucose 4-epimerase
VNWSGLKVLVTGDASFIGSHLVERLVLSGAEVTVADNFSSGLRVNLGSVADMITTYEGDLNDRSFAGQLMKDIDGVFHLTVNHGGRRYTSTHPTECSSNMTIHVIVHEAAKDMGAEIVCHASSACVCPQILQSRDKAAGREIQLSEDATDLFTEGKAFAKVVRQCR